MNRLFALLAVAVAVAVASCASPRPAPLLGTPAPPPAEIVYVSTDLEDVAIFTPDSARFGDNPLAFSTEVWPASPARYFEAGDGIRCVSIGPPSHSEDFAIKRPIRESERFRCGATSFRVTRCYHDCRAAVIERVSSLGGNATGTLTTFMYVDQCLGVLILSLRPNADLAEAIPLDARWLRGNVGILPHSDYPNCTPF